MHIRCLQFAWEWGAFSLLPTFSVQVQSSLFVWNISIISTHSLNAVTATLLCNPSRRQIYREGIRSSCPIVCLFGAYSSVYTTICHLAVNDVIKHPPGTATVQFLFRRVNCQNAEEQCRKRYFQLSDPILSKLGGESRPSYAAVLSPNYLCPPSPPFHFPFHSILFQVIGI